LAAIKAPSIECLARFRNDQADKTQSAVPQYTTTINTKINEIMNKNNFKSFDKVASKVKFSKY